MSETTSPQFALSIRQPWAWLIVNGYKDIENRTWKTQFRGAVYVHAGATMTRPDYEACAIFCAGISEVQLPDFADLKRRCGGIVGTVHIVDCVTASDSLWFVGDFGFVLKSSSVWSQMHACKGSLGFFRPVMQ